MNKANWGIVMTVMEPGALLMSNLAWHLGTGASEIHVYFDDPEDPIIPEAAKLEGVTVLRCDAEHWRAVAPIRRKPPTIRRRQSLNANHALKRCACDWLIHIDADEFLVQSRPLAQELHYLAELDCEVAISVAERIFVLGEPQQSFFDGVFRTTTKGLNRRRDGIDNERVIYGDHRPLLLHGVLGHSAGKCAVPRGKDFEIGIHWSYRGADRERSARYTATSTQLLHFDGLTPLHWLSKMLRYAGYDPSVLSIADHRRAQIEILLDVADDPEQILEFHREMKEFGPDRLDRIRGFGLLREERFDPAPTISRVLGYLPDLRPGPFDQMLLEQYPERCAVLKDHI